MVFDCSAKCKGTSLNDHLLSEPDLTNNLISVLCRFRTYLYAITCEVEKMFHQFVVHKEDRDYLRFLWLPNGNVSQDPREYRMKVHLFVPVTPSNTWPIMTHDFYVLESVPKSERAADMKLDLPSEQLPIERVLGVQW